MTIIPIIESSRKNSAFLVVTKHPPPRLYSMSASATSDDRNSDLLELRVALLEAIKTKTSVAEESAFYQHYC